MLVVALDTNVSLTVPFLFTLLFSVGSCQFVLQHCQRPTQSSASRNAALSVLPLLNNRIALLLRSSFWLVKDRDGGCSKLHGEELSRGTGWRDGLDMWHVRGKEKCTQGMGGQK